MKSVLLLTFASSVVGSLYAAHKQSNHDVHVEKRIVEAIPQCRLISVIENTSTTSSGTSNSATAGAATTSSPTGTSSYTTSDTVAGTSNTQSTDASTTASSFDSESSTTSAVVTTTVTTSSTIDQSTTSSGTTGLTTTAGSTSESSATTPLSSSTSGATTATPSSTLTSITSTTTTKASSATTTTASVTVSQPFAIQLEPAPTGEPGRRLSKRQSGGSVGFSGRYAVTVTDASQAYAFALDGGGGLYRPADGAYVGTSSTTAPEAVRYYGASQGQPVQSSGWQIINGGLTYLGASFCVLASNNTLVLLPSGTSLAGCSGVTMQPNTAASSFNVNLGSTPSSTTTSAAAAATTPIDPNSCENSVGTCTNGATLQLSATSPRYNESCNFVYTNTVTANYEPSFQACQASCDANTAYGNTNPDACYAWYYLASASYCRGPNADVPYRWNCYQVSRGSAPTGAKYSPAGGRFGGVLIEP